MNKALLPAVVLLSLAVPAGATEVEVTRFHTAQTVAAAAPGPIAVRAGAGLDGTSLETQVWLDAVAAALSHQGFTVVADAPRVAEVTLDQEVVQRERSRSGSGVSVGVGAGSGGGWYGRRGGTHVGVGVGLGFPIGGGRARGGEVDSELSVTIRDTASGAPLWEGRSNLRTSRRAADDPETAGRLAQALFAGFPGTSGATIEVE